MQEANFCPIHHAQQKLGGKWKLLILWHLMKGSQQFNQLKRSVGGISTKVLSDQLRELQADLLIHRKPLDTRPPTVEYSISETGMALKPILDDLALWSTKSYGKTVRESAEFAPQLAQV